MSRIRKHLTYANVMVTILAFVVLGGGTALAAYVVSSNSQIGPGTISGHKPPSGKHANIIAGSINGKDIADRSGVDTCQYPLTKKLGQLCVGSDGGSRDWVFALDHCRAYGLRLPSVGEAYVLALNYDVPGGDGSFWTDDFFNFNDTPGQAAAFVVADFDGSVTQRATDQSAQTLCVTEPSA